MIAASLLMAPVYGEANDTMKIKIKIGESTMTASLNDSKAARDFWSQLPLSLTLKDYAKTEKVSDLRWCPHKRCR